MEISLEIMNTLLRNHCGLSCAGKALPLGVGPELKGVGAQWSLCSCTEGLAFSMNACLCSSQFDQ